MIQGVEWDNIQLYITKDLIIFVMSIYIVSKFLARNLSLISN